MKKTIFSIGLGLVTVLSASAQNWTPQSFIADDVVTLIVSNGIATGGKGITNLLSTTSQGGIGPGTNIANTSWWKKLSDIGSNALTTTVVGVLPPWMTNALYTNLTATTDNNSTGTNFLSVKNLLDPCVNLWPDRNAAAIPMNFSQVGSNCYGSIMVRTVGGTALTATNQVTFVIEGVPYVDKDGNEYGTTAAGDRFIFSTVVSNGTTPAILVTNFPAAKYIGYKGIRCGSISIVNADGNANNQIYVTDFRFLGFIP